MHRSTLIRLLYTGLGAVAVLAAAISEVNSTGLIIVACSVCLLICAAFYKFDYLHPVLAYLLPWLMILVFSIVPISAHARPMEPATYNVLLITMFAWMAGCVISPAAPAARGSLSSNIRGLPLLSEFRASFGLTVGIAFVVLYVFAAINILLAGYIPLLSLITTGNSRYDEFGVPSVYGAFLAYANALGCIAFYIYLRSGRRTYLSLFVSVLLMHLAFVTRQNIATLLIEAFVIRSISVKRFSRFTMIWSIAISLLAFAALGALRSGDIKQIIAVEPQFDWIPSSLIWVYAYSYFNALNIDNMIATSGAPFFDGYMWQSLIPTAFRPDLDHGTYLEIANMTVSSYILPVYIDIGKGVALWTMAVGYVTTFAYQRAFQRSRFVDLATYGCLYFCALFSFFSNCWLYLPVIFQLVFFWIFHVLLFVPQSRATHPAQANEVPARDTGLTNLP
ncbi:MAG: oligosaccharide repeat unit polymerase [Pseudomonadota bacterium]|nr:oligosaccharide repeat unit polymerase [Pseudomonadota bacterium]